MAQRSPSVITTLLSSRSKTDEEFIERCSKGYLKQALQGFLPRLRSDPNLFSHLLRGCCTPKQSLSQGQQLHAFIIASGASSDRFTSNHLLHMYSKLGQLQAALAIFSRMPRKNVMSSNILIGGLIHNDDLDTARKLFYEMPERNLASWNAMVTGLTHFGLDEEGLGLFARMREEGFRPDQFSLASALRCSAGLKDIGSGRRIHSYIIQSGFERDLCVGSSLAHMYMTCGCLEEGEKVLKGMPVLNVVSSNTVIAGRVQNGDSEGALAHFRLMKAVGLAPDEVTFVGAISSCSDLASLCLGEQVHALVIKAGAHSVVAVRSSLVSMYSRCGCLSGSVQVFHESDDSDFVLWSAMIAAYGFHGQGLEAIELFEKMVAAGTEPTHVTFLSLLYACSHSGLKDKCVEYFNLMEQKYGLVPSLKHYTCVVDLLGRSGCLDEAEALIRLMPHRADAIIWKTLLSACKTHNNAEMAERLAERVLTLDPRDSASYVLLSNIRALAERWSDVSDVRRSMKERRVKKEPGASWFELKGQVHQFSVGDRSHPRQREIEVFLRELMARIRQCGYKPETSMVLHDMDDEEKECSLAQHSEKLAVAFALMSLPAGAAIRIMKNLRVCDDCHVAIKFISKVTEREIVVRDVSRFHHFRDGKCSCGDYW
ncbi:uncharacterized protein A4U43_C07F310 [Asparagus officinalis]|uniref:DYW domain-containing protein n=1 Tax=Asparagus officinalis TaxID=4686 RepID=A0A5P1E876_ASPOF|nr:pentatricopeptide repeat-containing protein At2g41080 [Asparagus officinalis]ONK62095.1 uncharacterized protein A4U43_C07F310 [Asparagus officinalis]